MANTFAEFKDREASEKVILAAFEARERVMGWSLLSGAVYQRTNVSSDRITLVEEDGSAYTEGSSTALSAGEWYHDRSANILYVRTTDDSNPNSKYIVKTENLYFSSIGVTAPYDHGTWSGYNVFWRDGLINTSGFKVEVDNENQLGEAIEGRGTITFGNEQDYWKSVFDKKSFFNSAITIYSWSPEIDFDEAQILFIGQIQDKDYSERQVRFTLRDRLNELRASVQLDRISDVAGVKASPKTLNQFQRRVYGEVKGHVPTSIDEVSSDTGYALSGTVSISSGTTTITGVGTSFLNDLSPDDELIINGGDSRVSIESIESDTSATLSEEPDTTVGGASFAVDPSLPKFYTNREFVIAGHALREPTTTITVVKNTAEITVDDSTDFEADAEILVGSERSRVRRVVGNKIRLDINLATLPTVGTTVKRLTVTNVRLGTRQLELTRDYTYDASTGRMSLEEDAEFNVAPTRVLAAGTVSFSSGSRTVTGSGTEFTSVLNPNSWIRARNQSTWYRVLQVNSDTELELRVASGETESNDVGLFKTPDVFSDEVPLSVDTLGLVSSGVWLNTVPEIVEHLLEEAGLSSDIDTASFDTAKDLVYQRVGYVIPQRASDTRSITYKSAIADLNKSVFGTLIQNDAFLFEYRVIRPNRSATSATRYFDADVLNWAVKSQLDKIAKTINVTYVPREFDWRSRGDSTGLTTYENETAKFVSKATRTVDYETFLVNENDAVTLAQRLGFLFSVAYTTISATTKLQAASLKVSSIVNFEHEKLFDPQRKVGAIKSISKDGFGVRLEIEDLASAFAACGTITEADANAWDDESARGRLFRGYVTDDFGMQDNDPDTFGVSRIW